MLLEGSKGWTTGELRVWISLERIQSGVLAGFAFSLENEWNAFRPSVLN